MKTTNEATAPSADAPRNTKAQLINDTIDHLQTVVARLQLAESETTGASYILAAEREPLAALLAQLLPLKSPLALLPDGRLACGHCGNIDREELEISEYVFRTWDLPTLDDDDNDEAGLVLDSGTDEVNWESSNDCEFLHCKVCDAESIIPAHVAIDWK